MPNYANKWQRQVTGGPVTLTNPASTASNRFYGTTLAVSRDTVVSAPIVAATSRISTDVEWLGVASLSVFPQVAVSSKVIGVGFYLSTVASVGLSVSGGASYQVHWTIENPT